jgi:coronin-1B/1C/6
LSDRRNIVRNPHALTFHTKLSIGIDQSTFAPLGHVFGRPTRKEQCYDNLRISKNAWDSNIVKANPKYLSVNWEAGGGGAFAVIPLDERGRAPEQLPLFRGHTAPVLDTDWSPFNDSLIASASDDGKVMIWTVPEGFSIHSEDDEPRDVSPVAKLSGHSRKVGHVLFNPSAENVLASSSGDYTIKLWDVEKQAAKLTLKHQDIVQSMSFSANGSLLVTTSRDKKLRVWDVRTEKTTLELAGHAGAKNSRAVWMGELDRIATTGFSKMSDRQLGLWDIRAGDGPIEGFQSLDSISSICMPFWDDGTRCLYLAGKGDGNIRYLEYENDRFEPLSEYKSGDAQRGFAFIPKRGVNVHDNEVMRGFKTVNDSYIEPISFIVPRRSETFQSDIYPPCTGADAGLSADDFFAGKDGIPAKIDLEKVYEGEESGEGEKKSFVPAPAPVASPKKSEPTPKKQPQAVVAATKSSIAPSSSFSSIGSSSNSMAAAASKFADRDEDEERGLQSPKKEDDAFEEVPVRRAPASVTTTTTAAAPSPAAAPKPYTPPSPVKAVAPTAASVSTSTAESSHRHSLSKDTISASLSEIKGLLEAQTKVIAAQSEKISRLTDELDTLKLKVASDEKPSNERDGKDERIRELELELESARS